MRSISWAIFNYIQMFSSSTGDVTSLVRIQIRDAMVEEDMVLPGGLASVIAIERLRKYEDEELEGFNVEEWGDCSVCLNELILCGGDDGDGEERVSRMPCGHVYHESCILTWLKKRNCCPLCRKPLEH